ncbi:MAG: hypothetical protein HY819_22815 [Acidobacteria bacterium]|nr:hypothetical protein [Acidobacteriota bacterium]
MQEVYYSDLKNLWKKWLQNNPIPNNIIELADETSQIRIAQAKSYSLEEENKELKFYEISEKCENSEKCEIRELIEDIRAKNFITIEDINTKNIKSSIISQDKSDKNQCVKLELSGIFHRAEYYQKYNKVILHLDYLVRKINLEPEKSVIKVDSFSLPPNLPQQTFIEARRVAEALSDGPRMIGWESITGGIGLRHIKPNTSIQARIMLKNLESEWQLPTNCDELKKELENLEQASLLLLNVAIGAALEKTQITAPIDALISYVGWQPRSHEERLIMRRKIWRWMLLFDSISVYGKRLGKYLDKVTGKEIDITSMDALIKVIGQRFIKDSFQGQTKEIPLEITWVAGTWLEQWRDNKEILNYFGDLRKIAAITTGKASGAWAQSIGLALHQLWRERIQTNVFDLAKKNQLTLTPKLFTRLELFTLFRCEPWVEDLLESNKPIRAKKYWQEAIRKLKYEAGIIGYYQELEPFPNTRKSWNSIWLKSQKLDIRPK